MQSGPNKGIPGQMYQVQLLMLNAIVATNRNVRVVDAQESIADCAKKMSESDRIMLSRAASVFTLMIHYNPVDDEFTFNTPNRNITL